MEETTDSERSVIDATLEFRIKDFSTATEKLDMHQNHHDEQYDIIFDASVYPNGANKDTEGWVVVLPSLNDNHRGIDDKTSCLNWTVSIIDIEGNLRFPRSFENNSAAENFTDAKYLEKSFILSEEDELLTEGVLLLRCDIFFDFKKKKIVRMFKVSDGGNSKFPSDYVTQIFGFRPQTVRSKSGKETGYKSGFYKAFEFSSQVLTPQKFQDLGKSSNVYLVYDGFSSPSSELKAQSTDSEEDIWKFDTRTDRFLLSLKKNVGSRLVESSPVIRRCIESPMKENHEKLIELSDVESETFQSVLFFLDSGDLRSDKFDETVEVYKFSHFYGMEKLQQKCAEQMAKIIKTETDFEEIEKFANLYSDEYLITVLESRRHEYENLHAHRAIDRPDYNSYI